MIAIAKSIIDCERPLYPLDAPGMPLPGFDFIDLAQTLGGEVSIEGKGKNRTLKEASQDLVELYRKALYERGFVLPVTVRPGKKKTMQLIPGHIWGETKKFGPQRADVMVLGKMAGQDETRDLRNFVGPSGTLFIETLRKLGIKGLPKWYITNIIKCEHPEGDKKSTLSAGIINEFAPLLQQELRLVRPKYILCLGSDSVKALLGKNYSVTGMEGRVVEFKYPISTGEEGHYEQDENGGDVWIPDEIEYATALVMCCVHPAFVLRAPEAQQQLEFALARWGQLVHDIRFDTAETDIDHRFVNNVEDLEALAYEIRHCKESYESPGVQVIAVDGEWHGEHPQNKGSYLRSIQISWAEKRAAYIPITKAGGKNGFAPHWKKAIKILKKILKSDDGREVRITGQFLNSDMEWLLHYGLDLRQEFRAPPRWQDTEWHGGFDTGLAAHAIEETGDYKLETMAMRYTTSVRYDLKLQAWKEAYCKKHKIKAKDLEGYGMCPTSVLWPYGAYDADVTRRLYVVFQKLLNCDHFGNNCREAFWISQRAAPAVLEIHQTGLMVDRERLDDLTMTYMKARTKLEQKVRDWAQWPDFNINSSFQVREFLYGEQYNKKINKKEPGKIIKIRPDGAKSLRLDPLFDTSKRPVMWEEIRQKGTEADHTAGTNKDILAILAQESQELWRMRNGKRVQIDYSKQVGWVLDYRFTSQVLKSVLRPPKLEKDDDGQEYWVKDADGRWVYSGGLAHSICDDGRVRTHIYQTKETGRWSSARPPLQNLSKNREKDYARILGEDYKYALRSMLMASPGNVLVEADFIGAELFGMAMMAGDQVMIDHCLRNQLDEDDPNYYDIHSNIAVFAFKLDCAPTKKGLEGIGKENLRIVAKSVIFGIAYGRGAKAIALAAKSQKVNVSVGEAQMIIDAIFEMYPGLEAFFEDCKSRATNERWMCNAFGRFRRVPVTFDRQAIGDIERQLMNFPIQSMIADAVSRAIDHVWEYRTLVENVPYKIALQIHDAILLEVPGRYVPQTIKALKHCMTGSVPIYPTDLEGMPQGTGPYKLGVETEVCTHWGEKLKPRQCLELGFSPEYGHWKFVDGRWGAWKPDKETGQKVFKEAEPGWKFRAEDWGEWKLDRKGKPTEFVVAA